MSTRLCDVVVATTDPAALAEFWATLLGWQLSDTTVTAPPGDGWELKLVFTTPPVRKTGKNRLHLDMSSASPDEQMAIVTQAQSLGADRVDIGQRNVPWFVLADPEGNEFCVLEPRPEYATTGAVAAIVQDAMDPLTLGEFWSAATGWPVVETTQWATSLRSLHDRGPWLEFLRTEEPPTAPSRTWLELTPALDPARLVELGARRKGAAMVDPEGNEFRLSR